MMLKSLIEEFEQEVNNTRRLFDAIPKKDLDYKPASVSWTLAELAQHIAGIYTLYPGVFTQDEINMANVPKPGDAKDWDATLELFERSVERARAALNAVEEASLEQPWTFKAGNQVIMGPMPRYIAARTLLMNHLYHHRGEVIVYLRATGNRVPGLYGPSADDR